MVIISSTRAKQMAVGGKGDCLYALLVGVAKLDEVLWRASVSVMCGDEGSVKVGRAYALLI